MARLLAFVARAWLPLTIVLVAAITSLSLAPLPAPPLPEVAANDKLHHLVAYGLLAFPVTLAGPRGWPLWIVGFLAIGGAIELLQPYANRERELADWLANAAGLALGAGAGRLASRLMPRRR